MPSEPLAYFITFTCYGTWLHGDERGSVDFEHSLPDTPLVMTDAIRVRKESVRLSDPPFLLDARSREAVDSSIREVCRYRGWHLHAWNVRTNHVHVVVAADAPPAKVLIDFKAYATRRLVETGFAAKGQRVWTKHGSTRYLNTARSLENACVYTNDHQGSDL